ncbi:hypothetical protein Pfo_025031 [Paulownia fortunei]|nr:hypothetical protein Pfo_025031 [Paulownia fortunei]
MYTINGNNNLANSATASWSSHEDKKFKKALVEFPNEEFLPCKSLDEDMQPSSWRKRIISLSKYLQLQKKQRNPIHMLKEKRESNPHALAAKEALEWGLSKVWTRTELEGDCFGILSTKDFF